jgi:uncharacterized protein (TIGR01777 family)
MKIILPGGSGQVGTILAREFHKDGHEVVVLSRSPLKSPWKTVLWDGISIGKWVHEVEGADVLINLAGRSVNCRYHAKNRKQIFDSRIQSIRVLSEACNKMISPPKLWLQASTATIYSHRYDQPNDEFSGILGGSEPQVPETWKFSIDVANAWEKVFDEAILSRTRKIKLRSAMIMSPDSDGIFDTLRKLVRFGFGGKAGDGRQYISWIHYEDFVRIIYWLIENKSMQGVFNVAAPHPLSNTDFMKQLREALHIPIGLPATRWMLEVGAFFIRTETELILKSRRVVPARLMKEGFRFKFSTWNEAALDLCIKYKEGLSYKEGQGWPSNQHKALSTSAERKPLFLN